jgi:hypothetical protein
LATIDWALLCDHAFLDKQNRLCLIGIARQIPAPTLPLTLHQVMLVARLADIAPFDEVAISVGLVTPSGRRFARTGSEHVVIEMAGEYALATLREVPLVEEGVHRFQIRLRGQPVVSVPIPVLAHGRAALAGVQ